uniref:putative site-specific DNA endonuclease n=1 Tax=Kalinella pachyderma TaxID=2704665 RepID=UPI0024116708|nr:putative site-specific DNA endonuclease [Kalinella pachyderma]WDY12914.1 putative site-specific DNA endonuclease [Kalinella pachyderma]
MTQLKDLSTEKLAYLAGFLDGDGSCNAQIVRRVDYRLGFQIRVTLTFFQSTKRHWFLLKLKKEFLGCGTLRLRKDGMQGKPCLICQSVKLFLEKIQPYLLLKELQSKIVLEIYNKLSKNQSSKDFIQLCKKVNLLESLNDSKKRSIRAVDVENYLTGQKN